MKVLLFKQGGIRMERFARCDCGAADVTKFKIMLDNYMTNFDFIYDYKRDINI